MISARKIAVFLLLGVVITGCKHNAPAAPPPAAQAPILPPGNMTQGTPPPVLPPPAVLKVNPPGSDEAKAAPPPKPHHVPTHRKPKTTPTPTDPAQAGGQAPATPAPKEVTAPAALPPTQQAATGEPPDVSPIGQLSTAGNGTDTAARHTILEEITSTENGLNGIKRQLTTDEQMTATQIRTFLTKAKEAIGQDDLDGARTLVTKARVLLDELTKS